MNSTPLNQSRSFGGGQPDETSEVHSYPSRSLREAVRFSTVVAALFLIAAWYCLHWAYSRGAFGRAPVEHPVNLKAGSSIAIEFSVPYRGDRDIEIWYPRNASDDVCKDLDGILGKATLTLRGKEDVPGIFGEAPLRRQVYT